MHKMTIAILGGGRSTRKLAPLVLLLLAGCSAIASSGPSAQIVRSATDSRRLGERITVIDLDQSVLRRILRNESHRAFADVFEDISVPGSFIGKGDTIDIMIWEAQPAVLFSPTSSTSRAAVEPGPGGDTTLPQQMVSADGYITVPFTNRILAAGRTTRQIERDIVAQLAGKANQAQAIVRRTNNASANATIIGDVQNGLRIQLTPKGERILDALAAAGGAKQPVEKLTIQVTRGTQVVEMPLEAVIRDPRQNILLHPNDIVTVRYQPYSFTALGAVTRSAEVNFEATGLTLSQALGRIGGLQDDKADPRGVFVFRLEQPGTFELATGAATQSVTNRVIPVIYKIDMRDPAMFFIAQNFKIRDKDVIYVSNAPLADLQKFLNMISAATLPLIGVSSTVR